MSDKVILKEGIIDSVLKTIFSSKNKKKSKKIEKQVKKLNNALADFEKAANAELKDIDPKSKPFKLDRYEV
jgi:preprotein translocase subunit SecA|tara:strand:+ start:316 stop:528 length:213 start_codon:yes stop_codon:yes gene_type:complete